MESYKVNKVDKIIIYTLAFGFIIDVLGLLFSTMTQNRIIYFFAEPLIIIIVPASIIYSIVITISNKFMIVRKIIKVTIRTFAIIILIVFLFLQKTYFVNIYLDVPNIINSKYNYVVGKPTQIGIEGGKYSIRFFVVNGIDFRHNALMFNGELDRNKEYKITYLENSKYIIDIIEQ